MDNVFEYFRRDSFANVKNFLFILILVIVTAVFTYIGTGKNLFSFDSGTYKVVYVYDGDTIRVEQNGQTYDIRFLGIDTPELHKTGTPVQCFAEAAQKYLESRVLGQTVTLERDVEDKDKYDRLLRYVRLGDSFLNYDLVHEGYAFIYTYPPNTKYVKNLEEAQKYAIANNSGLWDKCDDSSDLKKKIKDYKDDYPVESVVTSSVYTESYATLIPRDNVLGTVVTSSENSSVSSSTKTSIAATTTKTTVNTSKTTTSTTKQVTTKTEAQTSIQTTTQNTTTAVETETSDPATCTISDNCICAKGNVNVSSGTMIYHLQGQAFYDKTKVNVSEGDSYFCSEDAAKAAGFRKSSR